MNTLGQYQNEIDTLPDLDLQLYERIFKVFNESVDTKSFYFYNILKKVSLPDNIDSEMVAFYTVQSPMAFTTIAHNVYGDIRAWWLIFLANKDTIKGNIFVVPAGTQLKYIKVEYLSLVFAEITNMTVYNGRHF